jgi:DNA-directed RNA polymerase subunit beta
VRDVHPTHYGRICPIETPEGPNIGLIASLSTYARVNDYGFIETPYRQGPKKARSPTRSKFYSARSRRRGHYIAQANAPLDETTASSNDLVSGRVRTGDFVMVKQTKSTYMDVSPNSWSRSPRR